MKNLRNLLLLTFAFISCFFQINFSAHAANLEQIKKNGTLTVGVKDALYPFGFVDEKTRRLEGYDIDFAKYIAEKLGVKLMLKTVTSANRIPMINQGNVDLLIATMTRTAERAKMVEFSYPYFISEQKFIVRTQDKISSLSALEGKRIGTTKGSTSEVNATKSLPNAKVISFDDYPQAFLALQQRKVSAVTTDDSILAGLIAKASNKKDFELTSFGISKEPYSIAAAKGDVELIKFVDETLLEMEKNGKAKEIFEKWFGPTSQVHLTRGFTIQAL